MKKIHITFKGTAPLLMHSCKCVSPLHPLTKEMKKYTSKRKKTEEDFEIISDLEWEGGLYWHDSVGLHIPAECIEATIQNGAKANKKGKDIERYFNVETLYAPLDIGEKLTKEELKKDLHYRDVRAMTVNRAKIMRTRPRFNVWTTEFDAVYDENKLDIDTIVDALEYAGQYVGILDSRPKYGKFVAIIQEI